MTQVGIGTEFRAIYADSNASWVVKSPQGRGAWNCVSSDDNLDYAGTKRVFTTGEIHSSLSSARFWESMRTTNKDWWAARKEGEIVHYHDGFEQFVRGVIVEHDGCMQMKVTALVGKFKPYDLPRYNDCGQLVEGSCAKKVRDGAIFQPDVSNMVEGTFALRSFDPRGAAPIDLSIKRRTPAQIEAKRLEDLRRAVQAALIPDALPASMTVTEQTTANLHKAARLLKDAGFLG